MRKFFKNPFINFIVVAILFIGFSVLAGETLEKSTESFLQSSVIDQFLDSSPPPTQQEVAEVKGAQVEISDSATVSALVSEVIDGDTIRLSTGEKVRYIGIDTPESVHPTKDKQCYSGEASAENELLVFGKTVILEKDVSETDRYGRLLRYVWLDGEMVNEKLVRDGYAIAKSYKPDIKYQKVFEQAQNTAQSDNKGLWANCTTN